MELIQQAEVEQIAWNCKIVAFVGCNNLASLALAAVFHDMSNLLCGKIHFVWLSIMWRSDALQCRALDLPFTGPQFNSQSNAAMQQYQTWNQEI